MGSPRRESDRWLFAWALASVALGALSLLVPIYYVSLGGGAVGLGLLAGIGSAAGAPGALLAGRRTDQTGRRRPYVLGAIALVAAITALLALVGEPTVLVAANGVIWFAAGAAAPVLTLLVTVGHEEPAWSSRFARLNVFGGWGWAAGLVLGTVWTSLGGLFATPLAAQRTLFVACAAVAALGFLLGYRWLPEDPAALDRPSDEALSRSILRTPRVPVRSATFPISPGRLYWLTHAMHPRRFVERLTPALALYLLAMTATFVGFGAFWGPLPLYLAEEGYLAGGIFGLYLLSSLGSALFYSRAGDLADRHAPTALNAGAIFGRGLLQPAVVVVGALTVAGGVGLVVVGATFVLIGLTWAIIAVTATVIVTGLAPPALRGQSLGLYTAISGLASGVGAVLGGAVAAVDLRLSFGVSAAFVLCGGALVIAVRQYAADAAPATDQPTTAGGDPSPPAETP